MHTSGTGNNKINNINDVKHGYDRQTCECIISHYDLFFFVPSIKSFIWSEENNIKIMFTQKPQTTAIVNVTTIKMKRKKINPSTWVKKQTKTKTHWRVKIKSIWQLEWCDGGMDWISFQWKKKEASQTTTKKTNQSHDPVISPIIPSERMMI